MPVCLKANAQSSEATICGKILNYDQQADTTKIIQVEAYDLFSDDVVTYAGEVMQDGSFSVSFPENWPQDVEFIYNGSITLFVKPDDKIMLEFDARNMKTSVHITETNGINDEMVRYQEARSDFWSSNYQSPMGRYSQLSEMRKSSPTVFKQFILDRLKKERAFCARFIEDNHSSQLFREWVRDDLDYECADNLIYYASSANAGAPSKHLPRDYFDFLDTFQVNYNRPFFLSNYLKFLSSYNISFLIPSYLIDISPSIIAGFLLNHPETLAQKQISRLEKISRKGAGSKSILDLLYVKKVMEENDGEKEDLISDCLEAFGYKKMIEMYMNKTHGLAREILLSRFFYQLISEGKYTGFVKDHLEAFNSVVGTAYMRLTIQKTLETEMEKLRDYTLSATSKINYVPVSSNDSVFNRIVEKYRGKVVYIDLWATWCVPCMAAMPASKALFNEYKDKDVVFLFLAVRSREDVWKSVIANTGIPGEHFLLKEPQIKALNAKFRISSFPHYLLVDKKGYVKDDNALHPDDKSLRKEIDGMLLQ